MRCFNMVFFVLIEDINQELYSIGAIIA
ncbi:UDP-3-O-(3-hydroxymyristoyl)glucosamine N-acyltransferase [Burkholderia anthina]|uniref:UDP-3-O-(3-hydroxymyristoyl)glucosamine N-acyltransferase n=1 Tax=Burkholderia anthina TaxID=179879 RepID=A0AAW3PYH1_9BURK|nr:UDP-3-O-(3-hydroxymyristoyl)glucosamine N-acyltransferase [Burkholderia anthina]KVH07876.1 UDP-3-O-(3-hydroxymyristoyl)glucosamine N-acyltransferase [Burkholderia anthina]KVH10355.1 UDP-3-O-(3-hydroxymyristoyl)glucosamine N-acyltransferase [Burkholderia anthina]KVM94436.1 UDP-3-O-(3-hydroxymyristoyl)glucosamine N-acyltransferase [Burkholderia anthina]KVX27469.1 UDP-3-O-(3-hydroxymyristoyl)glucosamine N-acyltransferase [Burkholderia anthina]